VGRQAECESARVEGHAHPAQHELHRDTPDPQGERRPTYIANLGLRHELNDKKTALVLTVSDVFNSLKERTVIDTPILREDVTRRRSSRIIYAGLIYNFGKPGKKKKDDTLQFDSSL